MPAERAPMRKIREALRLKHALGLSERLVAMSVGVSRSTVAEYLRRASVVGITWPVPETMDDAEFKATTESVVNRVTKKLVALRAVGPSPSHDDRTAANRQAAADR